MKIKLFKQTRLNDGANAFTFKGFHHHLVSDETSGREFPTSGNYYSSSCKYSHPELAGEYECDDQCYVTDKNPDTGLYDHAMIYGPGHRRGFSAQMAAKSIGLE